MSPKIVFQKISYLQYPFMLAGLFFALKPYVVGFDTLLENFNYALLFMGVGISFSTLQDTTKTQNAFSRRIWEHPKKGKIMLWVIACTAAWLIVIGLFGTFFSGNAALQQVATGVVVMGIGMMGMLKSAIEMFEHHRKG